MIDFKNSDFKGRDGQQKQGGFQQRQNNNDRFGGGQFYDKEDRQQNDEAAEHMGYILSAYTVKNTKIWIITDYGWDVTTILLPEEY